MSEKDTSSKKEPISEPKMARDGEFLRIYTNKYGLTVTEHLNIGRIKWEIYPLGSHGKDGCCFYLKTAQMRALCDDFRRGIAQKKIIADAANTFPSAYQYATGNNASLHLNIGGGNKGCRIQLQNKDPNDTKNLLVITTLEELEDMAYKFLLFTGLFDVPSGYYYDGLRISFEEGRAERSSRHTASLPGKEYLEEPENESSENIASGAQSARSDTPVITSTASTTGSLQNLEEFIVTVFGEKQEQGKYWVFQTVNKEYFCIKKEKSDKYSWFGRFENAARNEGGAEISFTGVRKNDKLIFNEPISKGQRK